MYNNYRWFYFCFSYLSLLYFSSCTNHKLPINSISNVNKIDSQIQIKNWELTGPFLDTPSYTWHEAVAKDHHQLRDSLEFIKFRDYSPPYFNFNTGKTYNGEFVKLHDKDAEAVNAVLGQNNNRYNFGGQGKFTVQFNVKLNEGDKSYSFLRPSILSKRKSFNDNEPGWCIYLEAGIWKISVGQKDKKSYLADGTVISDGNWHTITAVFGFEKGAQTIRTYTDGEYNNELKLPASYGSLDSNAPLTLGFLPGNINNPADFYASELKIWNTALNIEKIRKYTELKQYELLGLKDKSLIGYWPCNEGQGDRFKNHVLTNADFILQGEYEWNTVKSFIGRPLPVPGKPFFYDQPNDFVHLNKAFKTNGHDTYSQAGCYAACTINSTVEQDVAFLMGIHDAFKIRVNKKLCVRQLGHNLIGKNQYAEKVHLTKGNNEVVIETFNSGNSNWAFHLDVSSISYVKKYAIGVDYYSICPKYLIKEKENLVVRPRYPSFITAARRANLQIIDTAGQIILNQTLPLNYNSWTVPLNKFAPGAYRCILTTDADTIAQKFVYGNYKILFTDYQKQSATNITNDKQRINMETLFRRFNYLDEFGERNNVHDENLERKISATLFDIGEALHKLSAKKEAFAGITGLHIRGFRSAIDHGTDEYMVCVPDNYDKAKPLPLVIMMPYVTKQVPFIESYHVADIDRIELINKLCNKYGFAALWPSSRIFRDYNLNPIVSAATFEAINAVKKDYSIDDKRLYLYGDCSGGLEALLIANRFPSMFAAVGVEGPELSYTMTEKTNFSDSYPSDWTKQNNLIKTAENFKNIPVLIMHTKNDEKADITFSQQLQEAIVKNAGNIKFDNLNNATKTNKIKLLSEGIVISKIMEFFHGKALHTPDTINYSTYQLKYNKAYWITIDKISDFQKATVHAVYKGNKNFEVNTSNIGEFTVDANQIANIDKKRPFKVSINGKVEIFDYPKDGKVKLVLNPNHATGFVKNKIVEGPINDFFSSSFILVKSTNGNSSEQKVNNTALDTITANWKSNYFNDCNIKKDKNLSKEDIKNNNLILIGSQNSNLIIEKIYNKLPLKIKPDYIQVRDNKYKGNNLNYAMVYPNPLNPAKYILIIGTNSGKLLNKSIKDLSSKGFYDYEIRDNQFNALLGSGHFNNNWH